MNSEQFTDGFCDFELQELLLREDLENFNQALARAHAVDMARKTVRMKSWRRPNHVQSVQDFQDLTTEAGGDSTLTAETQQIRKELTRLLTHTDQRLDQMMKVQNNLAKQIDVQSSKYDEVRLQLQMQESRQNDLAAQMMAQMQNLTTMIVGSLIFVTPSQIVTPDGERTSNATLRTQMGDRVETTHGPRKVVLIVDRWATLQKDVPKETRTN